MRVGSSVFLALLLSAPVQVWAQPHFTEVTEAVGLTTSSDIARR